MEWAKVGSDDGIRDDRDHKGVQGSAKHRILLARMTDANDVVHITQCKLEQFVGKDAGRVCKTEQTVIGKDGAQAHGASVQDGLVAETAKTCVAVYNLNVLADDNIPEDGEK